MNNEYDYDLITDYLNGELPSNQKAALEERMKQDEALAKTIAFEKDLLVSVSAVGEEALTTTINEIATELNLAEMDIPIFGEYSDAEMSKGIQQVGKEALKEDIQDLQLELEESGFFNEIFDQVEATTATQKTSETATIKQLTPIRKILSIAAGVAILVFGTWFAFFNKGGSPIDQHFQPYANLVSPIINNQIAELGLATGDMVENLKSLQQGMKAYEAGDYTSAINRLSLQNLNFLASKDRQLINFYLSLSYLGNKETAAAIPILVALANNNDFVQQAAAKWYLMLAYLEIGNEEKADTLKNQLQDHPEYGPMIRNL